MLTQNTLDSIVYEYQHGGVKSNHPELTTYERKALLKYLFSLPTTCPNCGGKGEVYVGNDEDYTIEPCVA
jgi:hypothetical protein